MKVIVQISDEKEYQFDKRMKVGNIIQELQLNPESVLVIKGNELLTSEDWIEKDEEIKIRGVISGG